MGNLKLLKFIIIELLFLFNLTLLFNNPIVKECQMQANKNNIIPDIKVNNLDGTITLSPLDTITVTISLNNNGITKNSDWWLIVKSPLYHFYFYNIHGYLLPYPKPTYQGPLFYLASYKLFSIPISKLDVYRGKYKLYFGVDLNRNGKIDWDNFYYDSIEINIVK